MRRIIGIAMVAALALAAIGMAACSSAKWKFEGLDAAGVAEQLKADGAQITTITALTEETDSNDLLGRPNGYASKCFFTDSRYESKYAEEVLGNEFMADDAQMTLNLMSDYGGTIEVYKDEKNAQAREEYLNKLSDPSLGAFGVNAYIYRNKTIVLRVSYTLTADQAAEYEKVLLGGK